jgi:hypothetical protein
VKKNDGPQQRLHDINNMILRTTRVIEIGAYRLVGFVRCAGTVGRITKQGLFEAEAAVAGATTTVIDSPE